jgi:putative DeoR family transcriptional regulator (stage III sporulation protein D)
MTDTIEKRACQLAVYMIETGATVRTTAKHFGISKSTVHKDLTQRLRQYNRVLYEQVRLILEENKAQRHIRGGMATREKYLAKQKTLP